MIGLRFKLTQIVTGNEELLEDMELISNDSKTKIRNLKGTQKDFFLVSELEKLNLYEASQRAFLSYHHKLMSNERLRLSVNAFLYDKS